jgi:hypothetical protein
MIDKAGEWFGLGSYLTKHMNNGGGVGALQ